MQTEKIVVEVVTDEDDVLLWTVIKSFDDYKILSIDDVFTKNSKDYVIIDSTNDTVKNTVLVQYMVELLKDDACMYLSTKCGEKVIYKDDCGYKYETEHYRKIGLVKGELYTVYNVEIGRSSSSVYLVEYPGVRFNTVCFKNIKKIPRYSL